MEISNDLRDRSLSILNEFLRLESVSAGNSCINETASYLKDLLNDLGINSEIRRSTGNPVVIGRIDSRSRRIIIYNHYDVQPADPLDEWKTDPFNPRMIGKRLYARGVSDNKGTLIARLIGIYQALKDKIPVSTTFLYEGEEEIGSPNLENFIKSNKNIINGDSLIMEGGTLMGSRPVISLGVKGLLYIELSYEIGSSDVHSSMAPVVENPAMEIIKAISALSDGTDITIPGFYKDIRNLTEDEINIIKEYPVDMENIKRSLGVDNLKKEGSYEYAMSLFTEPTFNIDGFSSGYSGKGSKTIIPKRAVAKIDMRLVPDQDPNSIYRNILYKLDSVHFKGTVKMLGAEYPVRTSPDGDLSRAMIESAETVYKIRPVIIINSPGTQPMGLFTRYLKIKDAVSAIGVGDEHSRAHAPNESIDIDNFFLAIKHTYEFIKMYYH
ncbi:M20/M25/M40 family metallo-hydrolase [Picrophilus oshimae]|uniref:N-acyl-L-amino acid amidohydrolase n=1 Tax=Picrophilus torridus (strain ATCC 700027 / DSM 9790 / JCM 10055 / NBRC 100828 / KAW 2/3) TaxID=1122961 RepID=Q6L031_PICTO|nr:M20/M25/M40 family metallo-hydrolase [Picrophilus oshimae]AAT43671.1 N-acyl-L-amino acid amidohydrolase [Picrophilus oshimae DSM 9789]